ncbi:ArsC family reductase [Denitromonas sp. IR12]|uniref:ArsC family reductase n=2 Tax=Denitromonas iodatirespirans TaxID=2795389 RepID=A0A944DBJ8_DENI1|nr:ArsC family reductase [Denitromonas iodatirespirans]
MIRIYGIRNCDTMKKAFTWLDSQAIAYAFHDYKREGIDETTLADWIARVGRTPLVNTRGTTWRKLPEADRRIDTDADAIALMAANPSLIKRPVLDTGDGRLLVGFDADTYATALTEPR